MQLNSLKNSLFSKKKRKRVGRGIASGLGKTCGRGHKGQKSRSGVSIRTEGGQTPIIKRLPKRGFISRNIPHAVITLDKISSLIAHNKIDIQQVINLSYLQKLGVISKKFSRLKVINGIIEFGYAIKIAPDMHSKSVEKVILSSGGEILK